MRERRNVAVDETSYYDALSNLCNETGATLKPKVRYVSTPKGLGAGLPDGGLYTAQQLRRGAETTIATTPPERGCVEVKGLKADVLKIAASEQVEKYLKRYGQVLVTNYRDFLLVARDEAGVRQNLERYTLAASEQEFWTLNDAAGKQHAERFGEYLKRVMLHAAPLASPEDVARFLASYARDARARVESKTDLPALQGLREALEQALGLKFEGERGEHFFRSTLVQTLFYGIFSAWVLWAQGQAKEKRHDRFQWKTAAWYLRVPMINALFQQLLMPAKLEPLGLVEVLDWTEATLNRIENPTAFIQQFTEGHAVQYFYEPFLQEFDPDLRKQLGVWYTPQEIVRYMVERVDRVLREELGVAEGLAGEEVYVLDPCCGTGTYLVEVLRRIERTLEEQGAGALAGARLREAATRRVFGFEILPAPFVVAHLQLGLLLQTMGAALEEGAEDRVGVFLTNALTGWEPPKGAKARLLFPELEEERDRAEEVKQKRPILVVIGNPPYNAFAGTSPEEEQGLVEPYKDGLNKNWGIKKFNLDDLYVRFFRLAERRITEQTGRGVVCYVSNYSYLSDPSFVVMRERFLKEFDAMWFDSLNGDSRETGKLTPEGFPDPSIFSTPYNKEGIRVGTAIGLMVRKAERDAQPTVRAREFWGVRKREDLLDSLKAEDSAAQYAPSYPDSTNRYTFRKSDVSAHYLAWAKLTDLCSIQPLQGMDEDRANALIDVNREVLSNRMELYFNKEASWDDFAALRTGLSRQSAGFIPENVRGKAQKLESFQKDNLRRYLFRPDDARWCYFTSVPTVWKRSRPELWKQLWKSNSFLLTRAAGVADPEGIPFLFTRTLFARDCMRGHAVAFPIRLRAETSKNKDDKQISMLDHVDAPQDEITANLSPAARAYLAALGVENVDEDKETAALVWMHALAIGYSPAYLSENADGIRNDFPRVPLPASADALKRSAALGRQVADLLAYDTADAASSPSPLKGVVATPLRAEMRVVGIPSRTDNKQLSGDDFALAANWGYAGQNGVTMPGKGRSIERDYTDAERAAIEQGAAALGISADEAFARLGATTFDVYLNDAAYWRCVPSRVWDYYIGGYQVIKKWLSYRERALLKRNLTTDELSEVSAMVRRLAALRLLESALDENYQAVKADTYDWNAA
ncbi:MAG: hypothetical protein QOE33_1869 [Acidobacteriota bacterium]|nr:hypothetical protein [Acidobacteriota bacterium]